MCILLVSDLHPEYPLILLNNRDEFLSRPTARAHWWHSPNSQVLGGRDLERSVHGTWLGITRQGRLAILTNFREEGAPIFSARSRGEIPIAFLTVDPNSGEDLEGFAKRLIGDEAFKGAGGFSLAFGILRRSFNTHGVGQLALLSNRTPDVTALDYSVRGTWGLSNSYHGDRGWAKVTSGEQLLEQVINNDISDKGSIDTLIEKCFEVLSKDTLPKWKAGDDFQTYTRELRKSIFIPAVGGPTMAAEKPADELASARDGEAVKAGGSSGVYGTQKQTVILMDRNGHVTFTERTLYDEYAKPCAEEERDVVVEFDIEGWEG